MTTNTKPILPFSIIMSALHGFRMQKIVLGGMLGTMGDFDIHGATVGVVDAQTGVATQYSIAELIEMRNALIDEMSRHPAIVTQLRQALLCNLFGAIAVFGGLEVDDLFK